MAHSVCHASRIISETLPEIHAIETCGFLAHTYNSFSNNLFLCFWPGLGLPRPKAIVVIPKNQPLPKHLRKKTSKSAKHACHYATKKTR